MTKLKLLYYIPEFIVFYLAELVKANFYIAFIILSPKMKTQPGFIEFPLKIKSPAGLLLFSNLISMTPGSLSAEISEDKKTLLIHALMINDEQKAMDEFESIQKRILRLTN